MQIPCKDPGDKYVYIQWISKNITVCVTLMKKSWTFNVKRPSVHDLSKLLRFRNALTPMPLIRIDASRIASESIANRYQLVNSLEKKQIKTRHFKLVTLINILYYIRFIWIMDDYKGILVIPNCASLLYSYFNALPVEQTHKDLIIQGLNKQIDGDRGLCHPMNLSAILQSIS